MKKIVLKETQVDKLMNKIVSEQILGQGKYEQDVKLSFNYYNIQYKGAEYIDLIENVTVTVYFNIDIEARRWGIKSIGIYGFQGPEEVQTEATYYLQGSDDPTEELINLKLNWNDCEIESTSGHGLIGVDKDGEVDLAMDENGSLIATKIYINTFGL